MNDIVTIRNGSQLTTTSLVIAQETKLSHESIIKLVRKYKEDLSEFGLLRFEIQPRLHGVHGGGDVEYAILSEPQTTLLYTFFRNTPETMRGKKYITKEFYRMRDELTRLSVMRQNEEWRQARIEGKGVRRELTDAIKEFIDYADKQGSRNAQRYYGNITNMEYKALALVREKGDVNFRDKLSSIQNIHLATAESIARRAIAEGMTNKMYYKEIYVLAKQKIEAFADLIGVDRLAAPVNHQ